MSQLAKSSSGSSTRTRSTISSAQECGVTHWVIPWDDVSLTEAHRDRLHRARCGDRGLRASCLHDLPVIAPIDESGRMVSGSGVLEGFSTDEVEDGRHRGSARARPAGRSRQITDRYPICWRCKTLLVFRVVDDWFISADEIVGSRCSMPTRPWSGHLPSTRRGTTGCATWATGTSRASGTSGCRASLLPVRLRPPDRHRLARRAARGAARPRRVAGATPSVDRRRRDLLRVPRRGGDARARGGDVARRRDCSAVHARVGQREGPIPGGYATGAAKGLTTADPRSRVLGAVVPG